MNMRIVVSAVGCMPLWGAAYDDYFRLPDRDDIDDMILTNDCVVIEFARIFIGRESCRPDVIQKARFGVDAE